ncbi:MAG TPA: hypothetical protein VME23_05180 [Terracidiphilus sp.]|nr:hypothetical protein [Terracidiphilus sp.]
MADLEIKRTQLHGNILDLDLPNGEERGDPLATAFIQNNWNNARHFIGEWWDAYKEWEEHDTFNTAMAQGRMTMRSFGEAFDTQVKKTAPMNIAETSRFYSDSNRTQVTDPTQHEAAFKEAVSGPKPPMFGWKKGQEPPPSPYAKLNRGIDASAFAVPANFATREAKYKNGLHDLSVKLVIPNTDIKQQSHHQGSTKPHFCFLPISKPEDQYVIYTLTRYAKALKATLGDFYTLIRGYRSEMTRVKLANELDMDTGLVAVATPGRTDNLPYKVSYSLGGNTKDKGPDKSYKMIPVTPEVLRMRRQAYFIEHAKVLKSGNEVVIAMRKHAGPFPVYAVYDAGTLKCFTVGADNKLKFTPNRTISATGVANW